MISVIMPIYKNENLLDYTLERISRNLPPHAELLIVDDCSGPAVEPILQKYPTFQILRHKENRGNTVAYNTGAEAARGDTLVFIDSDIIVVDDVFSKFEQILQTSEKKLGAVGSTLLYPHNGAIQHVGVAFDRWTLSHVYNGSSPQDHHFEPIEERQAVTAALFACSRKVFLEIGGFCTIYRDGLEDIDFCLQCKEKGYRNVICTEIRAYHFESATRKPYKDIRRTYNYSIFFSRWRNSICTDLANYRKRRFRQLKPLENPNQSTIVTNFCTTPNWASYLEDIESLGVNIDEIHDLSGFIAEPDAIDLFKSLPSSFHKTTKPLIILTDHHLQIANNKHWFETRPRSEPDVIIDRHANAVKSVDL